MNGNVNTRVYKTDAGTWRAAVIGTDEDGAAAVLGIAERTDRFDALTAAIADYHGVYSHG